MTDTIRVAVREYASLQPNGVEVEHFRLLNRLEDAFKPFEITWRAEILSTEADVDGLILPDEFRAATGGKLPALWLNTSFLIDVLPVETFAPMEKQFDLILLGMDIRIRKARR